MVYVLVHVFVFFLIGPSLYAATKIVHEGLMTSNQPTSIHKAVTLKRNVNKTTKAVNVKQDLLDAPNAAPNVSSNSSSSLANGIRSISSTSIVDALVEANAIAGGSKPATNLPTAIGKFKASNS